MPQAYLKLGPCVMNLSLSFALSLSVSRSLTPWLHCVYSQARHAARSQRGVNKTNHAPLTTLPHSLSLWALWLLGLTYITTALGEKREVCVCVFMCLSFYSKKVDIHSEAPINNFLYDAKRPLLKWSLCSCRPTINVLIYSWVTHTLFSLYLSPSLPVLTVSSPLSIFLPLSLSPLSQFNTR